MTICCCFRPWRSVSEATSTENQTYGVTTITGYKPGITDWINQDAYFVSSKFDCENLKSDQHLFCIFDGHGHHGHNVSSFCRDELMGILSLAGYNLPTTFEYLHHALERSDIDTDASGTTCTMVMIHGDKLEVYNVGDSKAMIARKTKDGLGFGFDVMPLTLDHTLDKEDEVKRILDKGGKVCSRAALDENDKTIVQGPLRVWYRCTNINSNFMGLAMTRSLGDSGAHKVGVSHEPFENSQKLTEDDEFIILGSDGIWDVISCEEAAGVINDYIVSLPPIQKRTEWCPKEAANILVARARRKWQSANHVDDITCCIIKLTSKDGSPCFV